MQPMPRIEIRPLPPKTAGALPEDPLAALVVLLGQQGRSDRWLGPLVCGLVAEGRRFAGTDSGRRWKSVLTDSSLAANGWMLWNMLDLDRFLTDRDLDTADTPAAMVEDLLRELGTARLEQLIRLISSLAGETSNA